MSIVINNLSKSFTLQNKIKIEVLHRICLQIEYGESVSLVGKSGSGKSTLLSIMAGLDKPSDGQVIIDNVNINKLSNRELLKFRADHIGFIFQDFHLIPHLTALENVEIALEAKNINNLELAKFWLNEVGLIDRIHQFPGKLSGGEAQRVAIARSLVTSPKYIFADEPSGSLDNETGDLVMGKLFEIVKKNNITLVLVTHDLELANKTNRIFRLDHGEIKVC